MSNKTLGEVIRMMVESALSKDDMTCRVRLIDVINMVNGSQEDVPYDERSLSLPSLKSSYIYNTTSRITSLIEKGLKATHEIEVDDYGDEVFVIKLVKGSYGIGTRKKTDNQAALKAVEEFKGKVMRVMPDISHFEEAEILIAAKVIKEMKAIIEEIK